MIDIKQIREDPERFKKAATDKHFHVDIDNLLKTDSQLLAAKKALQGISTAKNQIGKSIPKLPDDQKREALGKLSELKKQEAEHNEQIKELQPYFDDLNQKVPQPADDYVPNEKDSPPAVPRTPSTRWPRP